LLAQGLLAVEGDYGTLVLNEGSSTVLRRERTVNLRREPEKPTRTATSTAKARGATAPTIELSPEGSEVFERLRAWRGATAKEAGLPAYVIFHDKTLRQIATELPGSLSQLGTISGVGEAKLSKYGQQILDALNE
jgi:ATP-dependent DNA helicase RecQ